jgi:hypothetical protein
LEDIRVLKLEIKKLRRANAILEKRVANVKDLRYTGSQTLIAWREFLKARHSCELFVKMTD